MFCPLCKSEFRDGFTQCSDCHIPLVLTRQEAGDTAVVRVWKGGNRSEFESVLAAIQDAAIPLVVRERLNALNAARTTFLAMMWYRRQTSNTEFEITVLQSDAERAAEAVRQALAPEEDDES